MNKAVTNPARCVKSARRAFYGWPFRLLPNLQKSSAANPIESRRMGGSDFL